MQVIEILKTVGEIGGVPGLALGVFLVLYRDVIRRRIFPTLTKAQAFWLLFLILILVWSIALAGIAAWAYSAAKLEPNPQPEPALWLPPKLPENCKTAYFSFADGTWEIDLTKMRDGQVFTPDWGLPDNERAKSIVETLPAILYKNKRLYVRIAGWSTGTNFLSDPLILDQKLPTELDRNYSANAFEVVNKYCPILQIK